MKLRNYCAKGRFNIEHESFLFGTVSAESELMAEIEIKKSWKEVCPYEVEWLAVIPGLIVFKED